MDQERLEVSSKCPCPGQEGIRMSFHCLDVLRQHRRTVSRNLKRKKMFVIKAAMTTVRDSDDFVDL